MMTEEIGGYFQLERFTGREYHEGLLRLNLGRTALLYMLEKMQIHTLYVPHFLCGSVLEACTAAGIRLVYYPISREFLPVCDHRPEAGECLYLVNFYGRLTREQILEQKKKYGEIILDNTHAFFQGPIDSVPAVWSVRKYFGLADGAYVDPQGRWSVQPDADGNPADLPPDRSSERMGHILGRYEGAASDYYKTMLENAHALEQEPPRQMSPLTQNLLRAIDYEQVKKTREDNYNYLQEQLGKENALPYVKISGPFTYPFYHKNGMQIRREMAAEKVYIPTYWSNVLNDMDEGSIEYDLAANILPLPCDQRYERRHMDRIIEVFRKAARE